MEKFLSIVKSWTTLLFLAVPGEIIRNARCEAEGILILLIRSSQQSDSSRQFRFAKQMIVIQMSYLSCPERILNVVIHCSYFSALINQFLLDQVLEYFPLLYLCCWMNNQLSEPCKKCIALLLPSLSASVSLK